MIRLRLTAATAALTEHNDDTTVLTELTEQLSDDDTDNEDEDFAVENFPKVRLF